MDSISGGWLAITIAIRWGYHRWWYSLVRTTTAWCILSCPLLLLTIYPRLYTAQHRSMHDCTDEWGCTVLLCSTTAGFTRRIPPVAPVSLISPVGSLSLEKLRDLMYYVYQAATLVRAPTYGLWCAGCRIKSSLIFIYQLML